MALSTQVRAPTDSVFPWKYDVFLSFRGEDTRKGFTDHLYDKLQRQGIRTFRDDPDTERGTAISPELLTAIEQSRFAVVVLSPNYASSTWCLLELSKILECMEGRGTVFPIYYEVDPSHVRHQRGSFAEAFYEHEEKFGEDSKEVEGWRDALTKVTSLSGWSAKDYRYETELIREIVQALWSKVHPTLTVSDSTEKLVGMDAKLEEIDILLDKEANEVRFIGIWGMGGLGKTTLARLICEKISHYFEACIFLANVREVSATHGLLYLQKQMISQILKENVRVWDVYSGMTMTKRCLCNKAVLLVLDDVDQVEQLKTLVGEKDWFGLRSRIIITTRNRHILVTHGIEKPYELKGLNDDEALQLFSWKAFRKYEPEEDYAEHTKSFVMYAGGLPLALKTLGSFLYKRSPHAWSYALERLRDTPNRTIFEILKISFDGLDEMEKKIFLDITCFSSQCQAKFIIEQLYSSNIFTRIAIDLLVEKSLLTISSDNKIGIHNSIQKMGCEIVRQESYEEPGRRSRLWLRNDVFHVFTQNTGTEAIEGIFIHLDELEEADWNLQAFSRMCKLRLLYIHNLRLSLGPKCLPNALRFLNWSWYPSNSLPRGFQPDELTELSLVHSNIDHLWNGIKYLSKLKSIDLSYSINLTRTPDFTGIQNLEKLVLEGCTNLVKIHPSIALLKRLKIWNLRNCKSIKSLPSEVNMEFLETFDVSGCSELKMIPEFVGQMKRLSKLSISCTAVEKLPSLIEHFSERLEELDFSGIVIRDLPAYTIFLKQNGYGKRPRSEYSLLPFGLFPKNASLKPLSSFTTLNLNHRNLCEGEIPNDMGSLSSLKYLELRRNNFVTPPASIHLLSEFKAIDVENCRTLQQLPELPLNDNFSDPTDLCGSRGFHLRSINWSSMFGNQGSSYFIYSMLKRFLEVSTSSLQAIMIPGSEIPEWFNNQCVGGIVTEKLPSYACSKGIGVAVCALFEAKDNPSVVPEDRDLDPDIYQIDCSWNRYGNGLVGVGFGVKQINVSDHLLLTVFPSHIWKPQNCLEDTCNEVKFVFEISRAVGNNRCLQIKKCGARVLYEHDMEELIGKMNQSKSSISLYETVDCDLDKSATTGSGGSDDEYYSAEE